METSAKPVGKAGNPPFCGVDGDHPVLGLEVDDQPERSGPGADNPLRGRRDGDGPPQAVGHGDLPRPGGKGD